MAPKRTRLAVAAAEAAAAVAEMEGQKQSGGCDWAARCCHCFKATSQLACALPAVPVLLPALLQRPLSSSCPHPSEPNRLS